MKWVLFFWAMPIVVLGGWYTLSYYDINFGYIMLSRQMHDLVFQIYGNALGLPPAIIPGLVMKAVVIDSLVLFAVLAYRRRAKIRAAIAHWRGEDQSKPALAIDRNLSSAP
jgi:hypothetical protein